jgi:hypothetical protein
MKARGGRAILVCALAALTLPASAVAKPGYEVRPAGSELFLFLEDKGDYEISLEANDRQRVLLAAEEGLLTATEYSTTGRVSSRRIEADFGELGRIDIDVRLRPRHSEREPKQRNCKGPASVYIPGTFHGTIRFSGEGDIPPFSVKRGGIGFIRRFERVCKKRQRTREKSGKKKKPKLDVSLLEAFGKAGDRTSFLGALNFVARKKPGRSFGFLIAGSYKRSDEVLTESSTLTFFGHDEFRVSPPGEKPTTVKVELPEPFAGRSLYRRELGSPPSWTGNLTVDLPGARAIPLADFDSLTRLRFCRGSTVAEAESCPPANRSSAQPSALTRRSSDVWRYLLG